MKKKINKFEINDLALGKFEGEIFVVDCKEKIKDFIEEIKHEELIGVDTETRPTFRTGALTKTALIQIATRKKVYLFRLNKIGFPLLIYKIFENPKIKKIGIAVIQDMKELSDQFQPFSHKSVIDLNILCKSLGFENIGARNLTAILLGFRISKRQQTSNWEAEILTENQIRYAATDAWVALEIYLKLLSDKEFNI